MPLVAMPKTQKTAERQQYAYSMFEFAWRKNNKYILASNPEGLT